MFQKSKLSQIIFVLFVVMSVIPLVILSYISSSNAKDALLKSAFEQLVAVRDIKAKQLEDALTTTRKQAQVLSSMPFVISAMKEFSGSFNSFQQENSKTNVAMAKKSVKDFYTNVFTNEYKKFHLQKPQINEQIDRLSDNTVLMQNYYIAQNPYPLGKKEKYLSAKDNSQWSKIHKKYHPTFRQFLEKYSYYDIFLVDTQSGHIVYSVFKEIDFATSLKDGPFKDTNLASAYRECQLAYQKDFTKIVDLEPYLPSYEFPASFVSSPIFDGEEKVGILIMQIPVQQIDSIMTNNKRWKNLGFGKTAETYLVGQDYTMRSDA